MRLFNARRIARLILPVIALTLTATAEAKLKKDDVFPLLSLPTLQGKGAVDMTKYKGKVVIVDFWASWCEPCQKELPFLNNLAKKHKGNLVVIGVNLDEKTADAQAFLQKHPVQIPIAYDGAKKALADKAEIESMPTSFVIGKDGKIAQRHNGFRDNDMGEIEKEVAELLKK